VPAFDITARSSTGHEDALTVMGRRTCQVKVFECIDRYCWNIVPMRDSKRRFATHLAKALKRQIELRLVLKKAQSHRIKRRIIYLLQMQESH
jgi:hypothetical protein